MVRYEPHYSNSCSGSPLDVAEFVEPHKYKILVPLKGSTLSCLGLVWSGGL